MKLNYLEKKSKIYSRYREERKQEFNIWFNKKTSEYFNINKEAVTEQIDEWFFEIVRGVGTDIKREHVFLVTITFKTTGFTADQNRILKGLDRAYNLILSHTVHKKKYHKEPYRSTQPPFILFPEGGFEKAQHYHGFLFCNKEQYENILNTEKRTSRYECQRWWVHTDSDLSYNKINNCYPLLSKLLSDAWNTKDPDFYGDIAIQEIEGSGDMIVARGYATKSLIYIPKDIQLDFVAYPKHKDEFRS